MLLVAARPPDEEHAYGHGKAEYFASGFEGALILVAAVTRFRLRRLGRTLPQWVPAQIPGYRHVEESRSQFSGNSSRHGWRNADDRNFRYLSPKWSMRRRLSRIQRAQIGRPLLVVAVGAALTVGVLAALGGGAWAVYRSQHSAHETVSRVQFLLSRVAILDEVMTRSARMAAVTGDASWRNHYDQVAPALSVAIGELVEQANALDQRPLAIRLSAVSARLARMEREVFDLAAEGERAAALRLLSGDEYNSEKQVLTRAIERLSLVVQNHRQTHRRSVQRRALTGALLITVATILLLLIWGLTLALLRRYLRERTHTERTLSTLISNLPGVVYRSRNDPDWTMEYIGGRTIELLGYKPEDLMGKGAVSVATLIHPEDRDAVWKRVQGCLSTNEPFQLEYRIRTPDGEQKWVWEQGEGILSPGGQLEALEGFITDVTAIKQAEEHSRDLVLEVAAREHAEAAQERIRGILESITDAFFALDEHGRFTYVNQGVEELSGRARDELLGRQVWETFPLSRTSRFRSGLRQVLEERVPIEFEEFDQANETWVRVRAYPYPEGVAVYMGDITDRKRAEVNAELEQRLLITVLDALPVAVFLADRSGRITRTNAAAEQIWDSQSLPLSASPAEYGEYKGFWPGTGQAAEASTWGLARALSGETVHAQEIEIETFAGARKAILNYVRPIYDGAGERLGGVSVHVDITERKRAEKALYESELMMATVLAASVDVVEMLDLGGRFRWVSPAMQDVLGYEVDEVIGRSMQDLLRPEDHELFERALRQLVEPGIEEVRLRYSARHRDGHWVPMEARGRRVRKGDLDGLVLVARDVTEQEQLVTSLRAAKEEAEIASRAKSDLLSRISHELRTPMNAVLGFAQLLELDVDTEESRESVEQILRAGRHLLNLIDEVLDIAGAESGRMALSLAPVDAYEMIEEVISLLHPLAEKTQVKVVSGTRSTCNLWVVSDRKRLRQVLLNLVGNAIKYTRASDRVDLTCEEIGGGRVRLYVHDTGPGISTENLSRLFTPFERAGAEAGQVVGTGLGLSLSKALIQSMGGEIGAESALGVGSTFWIELPRALDTPGSASARSEQTTPTEAPDGGVNPSSPVVLYVDDEAANLRLVERVLGRSDLEVQLLTAESGRRGLELARERRPDLILLDLNLPDISGEDVLATLRKEDLTRHIPVVILSGDASPGQVGKLRGMGALDYLTKPFAVPHLLAVISEVLDHAGGQDPDRVSP